MNLEQFNLDKKNYYDCEVLKISGDSYLSEIKEILKKDPTAKERILIDKDEKFVLFIHDVYLLDDLKHLSPEQYFYHSICSHDEIGRIFNVKNNTDYLLKFRAAQIVDHPRLKRIFHHLKKKINNWNFSNAFYSSEYDEYLKVLPKHLQKKIRSVAFGNIYLKEANGYCMETEYGSIVVVSYALRYFLYYMNLFYLTILNYPEYGEPIDALVLGIRIMLGSEALDFEIDNRGELPKELDDILTEITSFQMKFVIGHEFAHHYLGHLKKAKKIKPGLAFNSFSGFGEEKFYNYNEKIELEADFASIENVNMSEEDKGKLIDGAYLFFLHLDIFKSVEDYIYPKSSYHVNSHPDPLNRLFELNKKFDDFGETQTYDELREFSEILEQYKKSLINDFLPFNVDEIEKYGSVYLKKYKGTIIPDRSIGY